MAGTMRQTPFDSSGSFSELVRQQLQCGEGLPSETRGPDPVNETNADRLLPRFASNTVSTVPEEQKMTGTASPGSPARVPSLHSAPTAIRQAPPDAMPPGKIEGATEKTPESALMVATARPAAAGCGSSSGALDEVAGPSPDTGPDPTAMVDGHHGTRSARPTPGAGTGIPSPMDAGDIEGKTDGTKIDDRSGVTGAGIADTDSASTSFRRVTTRRESAIGPPVLDPEVAASPNPGRTASKQIHGLGSMDETVAGKPVLSALNADETSSPLKVVSSKSAFPKENEAKASVSHLRVATESLRPTIAAEPYIGSSALAESSPVAATFASVDAVRSITVTLPVSKVILTTAKSQGARVRLPIGQTQSAQAAGRSMAGSLDDQQITGNSVGSDDRPESSPHAHSGTTAGRAVALNKVTVAQIPLLTSPSTSAKNSNPDIIASVAPSQAPPIHPTSGTATAQPSDVRSLRTPASATFDRMDAAAVPQVIENAPQRLVVGVHNAGLGWVEIRTNSVAGQVSATLACGSAETHSAISAQLPTMREHLASEHVHIDTLASERFSPSSGGRHNSSEEQSRNGGSPQARAVEPEISPGTSSMDVDTEMLSYINVRV